MAVGHSAGVAASMAHNASAAVQDVNLAELHARLAAEGQVLSLPAGARDATWLGDSQVSE